jgi:transposase-like protein
MKLFTSKYTKEERKALVEQWKSSGQTRYSFAKAHEIKESTFCHWVLKSLEQETGIKRRRSFPVTALPLPEQQPSFVAIQIDNNTTEKQHSPSSTPVMEITTSSGSKISFYETVPAEYLQQLLK